MVRASHISLEQATDIVKEEVDVSEEQAEMLVKSSVMREDVLYSQDEIFQLIAQLREVKWQLMEKMQAKSVDKHHMTTLQATCAVMPDHYFNVVYAHILRAMIARLRENEDEDNVPIERVADVFSYMTNMRKVLIDHLVESSYDDDKAMVMKVTGLDSGTVSLLLYAADYNDDGDIHKYNYVTMWAQFFR